MQQHPRSLISRLQASGTLLIRFALAVALLLGWIVSYGVTVINQQIELPGVTAALRIETLAPPSDSQAEPHILQGLTSLAEHSGQSLYVELPTPEGRVSYVAGENLANWGDTFHGLPGSPTVELQPLTHLPYGDYRQVLELTGDSGFISDVENYLSKQGVDYHQMTDQRWMALLGGTALGRISALIIFFCLALCFLGVMLNARADAVRRLHGYGIIRCWAEEIRKAISYPLAALVILQVLVVLGVSVLINADSALQWAKYQSVFCGVALLVICIAVAISLLLLRMTSTAALLGGKLPGKTVLAGVYLIRIGALIAVASMSIGAINYGSQWLEQRDERQQWQELPQSYSVELSGARSLEDIQETSHKLAEKLRMYSAESSLYFAQYIDAGLIRNSGLNRDIMVYNDHAAKTSLSGELKRVFDEARTHTTALPDGRALWLEPTDLTAKADRERVLETVTGDPDSERRTYSSDSSPSTAATWEVGVDEWMNPATVEDPIVVVLPNAKLSVSDRNIVAALTNKDALLADYEQAHALQSDPEIGSFIRIARPMAEQWASHHQTMGRTVWIYTGALLAAGVLSIIAAAAVLMALLKVFHQRLRASYIHGHIPGKLLVGVCAADCAVVLAAFWYLWDRGAPVRTWTGEGAFAGSADPAMIAMFSVPAASWLFVLVFGLATAVLPMALLLRRASLKSVLQSAR